MKSDPSEYKGIIKKLLEKTRQGRVEWSTDLGRNSFRCTLGGSRQGGTTIARPNEPEEFSFTVTGSGPDAQPILTMWDRAENEIFRAISNDLPTSSEEEEISLLLQELYDLARRQALRVEQKLEVASTLLDRV
jgi:hypothetical protein